MPEAAGHVLDAAWPRHADATAVDEERVVDRPALRRPFGDRDRLAIAGRVPAAWRSAALSTTSPRRATDRRSEAGGRLVQLDDFGALDRRHREEFELLRRRGIGSRLHLDSEVRRAATPSGIRRVRFPKGAIVSYRVDPAFNIPARYLGFLGGEPSFCLSIGACSDGLTKRRDFLA